MNVELIIPQKESGAEHWAKMTGEPYIPPKGYYRVGQAEYWQIFFGIAYPEEDKPGAVVSVAVLKEIDSPRLIVRDVVLKRDIMSLYKSGNAVRQKYQVKGGKIGIVWYGEPGRFDELRAEFNRPYRKNREDRHNMVVIGGPDGDETVDSGMKYMTTLVDLANNGKISFMPGCEKLQSALEEVLHKSSKTSISSYDPVIMSLGFACRAIMVQRPWLQRTPKYKPPRDRNEWAKGKSPWKMAIKRKKQSSGMFVEGGKWV